MTPAFIDQLIVQANQGDGQACFELYNEFKHGIHVDENDATAQEWLDKAIDFNHPMARLILDLDLLNTGHISEAIDSLKKECDKDNVTALNLLGQMYLGNVEGISSEWMNIPEGIELITRAANLQDTASQILLGKCYYTGKWVRPDKFLARYWLAQAAKSGLPEAEKLYFEACREITELN